MFPLCSLKETCATGVKPAETRRNAKPDDCATPLKIHNQLPVYNAARQLAGWADTARFGLQDQSGTGAPAESHGKTDSKSHCVGSSGSSIRSFEIDVFEHSSRATSIRDTHTHTDCSSKDQDGTGRTKSGYIIGATDP